MDPATIDQPRRLHEAATPPPWVAGRTGIWTDDFDLASNDEYDEMWGDATVIHGEPDDVIRHREDAELIVAVRNALPGLLAEIDRLTLAVHGCGCPAPYDQCTHDEPLTKSVARLTEQNTALGVRIQQAWSVNEKAEAELVRLRTEHAALRQVAREAVDSFERPFDEQGRTRNMAALRAVLDHLDDETPDQTENDDHG